MKRKFIILMTGILVMLFCLTGVQAASGSASVSVSDSSPVVGNKVTVTIKLSCSEGVGSAMVYIDYNSSYLNSLSVKSAATINTNGNRILVDPTDSKTVTITATLTARKIGNTSVHVTVEDWYNYDAEYISDKSVTKKIEIIAKSNNNPTTPDLSKDASLAALSLEGLVLESAFESDVHEYTVYAPANTAVLKINAKASSAKAKIEKTEFELNEGWNKVEVVCIAENGDRKTYVLNVYVEEKPIVYFQDNTLGVVRNLNRLSIPEGFTERKLTIQGEEISVFSKGAMTLVYLVNQQGQADFYLLDEQRGAVLQRYAPVEIDGAKYQLVNSDYQQFKEMEDLFNPYKVYIGETGIDGWKYKDTSLNEFAVIQLMNDEGETRLYSYDLIEKTLQRYTLPQKEKQANPLGSYLGYSAGAAGVVAFIVGLILASRKRMSGQFQ